MTKSRVALCVIQNHSFPRAREILRNTYRCRFPNLRFLFPLERTEKPDEITVYRAKYDGASYFVEHVDRLLESQAEFFFFLHDDVLLSSRITHENIEEILGLSDQDHAFIPLMKTLDGVQNWALGIRSIFRLLFPDSFMFGTGLEQRDIQAFVLPSLGRCQTQLFQSQPVKIGPIDWNGRDFSQLLVFGLQFRDNFAALAKATEVAPSTSLDAGAAARTIIEQMLLAIGRDEIIPPFPLQVSYGYADFFVLPRRYLRDLAHALGALSLTGLFSEVALPTAVKAIVPIVKTSTAPEEFIWNAPADAIVDQYYESSRYIAGHAIKVAQATDLLREIRRPFLKGAAVDIADGEVCFELLKPLTKGSTEILNVQNGFSSSHCLVRGIYREPGAGTPWVRSNGCMIILAADTDEASFRLVVQGVFVTARIAETMPSIYVGEKLIPGEMERENREFRLIVHKEFSFDERSFWTIKIVPNASISPLELGQSDDPRSLSFGLRHVEVTRLPTHSPPEPGRHVSQKVD